MQHELTVEKRHIGGQHFRRLQLLQKVVDNLLGTPPHTLSGGNE